MGEVADPTNAVQLIHNSGNQSLEGSIVAVIPIDNYPECMHCKGKVYCTTGVLGKCSTCNTTQKIASCDNASNTILIFQPDNGDRMQLTMHLCRPLLLQLMEIPLKKSSSTLRK